MAIQPTHAGSHHGYPKLPAVPRRQPPWLPKASNHHQSRTQNAQQIHSQIGYPRQQPPQPQTANHHTHPKHKPTHRKPPQPQIANPPKTQIHTLQTTTIAKPKWIFLCDPRSLGSELLKSNGPNSISKDALRDEDCPWPYMPITHSNSFQCGIICDNL